ncbi:hypothetical protein LZ198_10865 [Myxococcus sp. K15C18031901]|uniref:hypothetical protein n=1 Tax=Myxococcus dinghuensis TaxID=2906761 RepID=UPI0020A6F84B|nr:hypothetical protein [Myxococcus dinghuensis]MCP3099370.1 hypothetical protein [Myxococcus dinghuensis]
MLALSSLGAGSSGPQEVSGPGGLPSDATGPWLSIARWTVRLHVPDQRVREGLLGAFSRFVIPTPPPDATCARLELVAPETRVAEPVLTRRLPSPWRSPEGALCLEGEDYSARLDADGTRAIVTGVGRFPVEVVLRVMLAEALARRGGLLVHGVGVLHEARAALFTGHSGAGKSTLGGLWAEAGGALLSDELVALWPEPHEAPRAARWWAAGTPWNIGYPREAELTTVGTLGWDATSRVEPQAAGEVGRMLLLNALLPEATASGRSAMMASAGRLLSEVPPSRLVFARDASAARVIREVLGGMWRG